MLDHNKPYVEKMHYIDAELAGHVHKLDVKLQSLCGSGFSLFAVGILAKLCHFRLNRQTTLRKRRWGIFLLLKLECHNSYNNLLLYDSANGDIAQCNKNNSEWGFCVFLKKEQKLVSFKNKKYGLNKQKGWMFFIKRCFFNLDYL